MDNAIKLEGGATVTREPTGAKCPSCGLPQQHAPISQACGNFHIPIPCGQPGARGSAHSLIAHDGRTANGQWVGKARCATCGEIVVTRGPTQDDLAILRDHRRGEQRVLAEHYETPSEDIRNALQMLEFFDPRGSDYSALDGMKARLETALYKLDMLDELGQDPLRFTLRVGKMQRDLLALTQRFNEATLGAYIAGGGK